MQFMCSLDTRFGDQPSRQMPDEQVIKINDVLESLEKLDEGLVRVVEMRYFVGMTETEWPPPGRYGPHAA